jgi:uncharacterized protein YbjT (DUF2867 family)
MRRMFARKMSGLSYYKSWNSNYTGSSIKETIMKIVVIGGTGLIGSKLVNKLREHGHETVAAAPNTGVNTLTGEGLAEALKGASVVVDVSNSPSWEDAAVMKFFETSTRNLLAQEAVAGVRHHVALSVVGTERLLESGYFRAKIAQEKLIKESSIPYSIVHATQFFEFLKGLADISVVGDKVHLPPVLFQPMAADDVASAVGRIAVGPPVNGTVEIGGPEQFRLDELVRRRLVALKDPREVIADPKALYSGAKISDRTLLPGNNARLGGTRFDTWLSQSAAQIPSANAQTTRKAG